VAMFSFCAVMTDVNYAPLNGPPSPLLTSGISHSLIPILRELGMDVSISAGSPQGWPWHWTVRHGICMLEDQCSSNLACKPHMQVP
jgi:hypothetical protein